MDKSIKYFLYEAVEDDEGVESQTQDLLKTTKVAPYDKVKLDKKGKLALVESQISKVVAILKPGAKGTGEPRKLAEAFNRLDAKIKELSKRLDDAKDLIRNEVLGRYFTAEEACYTRCIELSELIIQVNKDTWRSEEKFDYKTFIKDFNALKLPDEIKAQLDELIKANYKFVSGEDKQKAGEPPVRQTVTIKTKDKLDEGIMDNITSWFKGIFRNLLSRFDTKYTRLLKKYNIVKTNRQLSQFGVDTKFRMI